VVRQRERDLVRLGQAIGQALFPDPIGARLSTVLGEARAAGTGLLLAFEAARLPDRRAPALEPGMRILRRYPDASVMPVAPLAGPLRLLIMDALIGRRAVLRRVMRVLRDHAQAVAVHGRKAGVLLWGMGGVGKSALAGRVMARLLEDSWTAVAVVGRWSLGELATRVGAQLLGHPTTALDRLGDILLRQELPDEVRLVKLQELLAGHRVLLVLDNFEDNLVVGGGDFLDSTIESVLLMLMRTAQRGKRLVTSRYPVPLGREWLAEEPLGPLSLAETRKLFYRLPSLANAAPETLGLVLRHIGGHPRPRGLPVPWPGRQNQR
jgi:hypothetical protein